MAKRVQDGRIQDAAAGSGSRVVMGLNWQPSTK
jgi:hypothetical protein